MCIVCKTCLVLVLIGALNWGLVGVGYFFEKDWNVVHLLLLRWPQVEAVVYILVGAAAVSTGLTKLGWGCKCGCGCGCNGNCSCDKKDA